MPALARYDDVVLNLNVQGGNPRIAVRSSRPFVLSMHPEWDILAYHEPFFTSEIQKPPGFDDLVLNRAAKSTQYWWSVSFLASFIPH